MLNQSEQAAANIIRLMAYHAKQTDTQRRRADIAKRVNNYSKNLDLNLVQRAAAIKLALKQLECSASDDAAYKTGTDAAWIIAQTSVNQRIISVRRRYASARLH